MEESKKQQEEDTNNKQNVICVCGEPLIKIISKDCYGGHNVQCDRCLKKIDSMSNVYHCPERDSLTHPHGYDLCHQCIIDRNQLSINKSCYCQTLLQKSDIYGKNGVSVCRNCCKSLTKHDKIRYICFKQTCFYKRVSTQRYISCTVCYNALQDDIKNDNNIIIDNIFIYNKFKVTMDAIR